jgi:sialate O-acetylesterase
MNTFGKRLILAEVVFIIMFQLTEAKISLPEIFGDNMVLQRNTELHLWGWAKTGENVTVKADWLDKEITVRAGNQGTWEVDLNTPEAGGPYTISLKGQNEIILGNILIGEVWLCSGQSNMEWSAQSGIVNGEEEIINANNPQIRLFTVNSCTSFYPQDHLSWEWSVCTPETMRSFSAIGYFFAEALYEKLGVPVGIINSSWGGTPAKAWMPEETVLNDSFLSEAAAKHVRVRWGPVEPGRIYNSMIAPIVPFKISGVLWYQGEANTINAYAYREMFTGLIRSWRIKWGYDFPFYFVQIAPYNYGKPFEGVVVRDAQRRSLDVPNTIMVVVSDIGDTLNIHPGNKKDLAFRLANMALNRHYRNLHIEDSGPLYREMIIEKNKAVISFDHSMGLYCSGKKLHYFEIARSDKIFFPAEARIKDEHVIVSSKDVKYPVAVRFAWSNTATPNLFNGVNLPASCFITE